MNCKLSFLFFALAAGLTTPIASAEPKCAPPTLRSHVELEGDALFLSDLFLKAACPALESAAARIRLGAAPLTGSPRILTKDQILAILYKYKLADEFAAPEWSPALIPQRITIERTESRSRARTDLARVNSSHALSIGRPAGPRAPVELHPGEPVTLLWEDGGIQSRSPAVCLDGGGLGERLRVRVPGGRIVHAVAVASRELRAVT
jgi:hypothetical protein